MSCSEAKRSLARDFATCVQQETIPALESYLAEYVRPGCAVEAGDWRLVPLTTTARRFFNGSSDCVADCMLELQCKYQQFIPDDWGGRMDRGWRDIGVIGFNLLPDGNLEIVEINETQCHTEWAETVQNALDWERLLIRAVIDFGRRCGAARIRLQPARRCYPVELLAASSPQRSAAFQEQARRRYDGNAEVCGFGYDREDDCFVYTLDGST